MKALPDSRIADRADVLSPSFLRVLVGVHGSYTLDADAAWPRRRAMEPERRARRRARSRRSHRLAA